MKLASASFLALFIGWFVAITILAIMKCFGPYGWFDDKSFWLFWPAVFIVVSWIAIVQPALAWKNSRDALSNARISWLLWTLLALGSFGVLVLWWMPVYFMLWFPAVVGLVAGLTFPPLLKSRLPAFLGFAVPMAIVAGWFFVVWPLAMKYATNFAYPLGSLDEQMRMMDYVVPKIRVGMTFDELNDLLPERPLAPFMGRSGQTNSYQYAITLKDGRVTEVSISPR